MKLRRNSIIIAIIVALVIVANFAATLRLFFTVMYPEREIREVITDFFKNNLNKAVKCNDIYMDYNGKILISDFDVSISSDFNDNISLIKSKKAVINLDFIDLLSGSITIQGLEFYNSVITFPKKYGRGHEDSLNQIFDVSTFLKKARDNYKTLYIDFKRTTLHYKESLRDRQVHIELYKTDASITIENNSVSYRMDGYIRPLKTGSIRKGSFYGKGEFDMQRAKNWRHRIKIDNFDLSYLNNYLMEYKLSHISLSGGWSCDLELAVIGDEQSMKGQVETNGLTITNLGKKHNIVSNENLNVYIEIKRDAALNSYVVSKLNLYDDAISLQASGMYVQNQKDEKLSFQYKTNRIDLADLSENIPLHNGMSYAGTIISNGRFFLDMKNNKATGSKGHFELSKFSLSNTEKGSRKTIIDESNITIDMTESGITANIAVHPLNSDLLLTSKTKISNWAPFRSDSQAVLASKKLNSEMVFHSVAFSLEKLMSSAYENKKSNDDSPPFLQSSAGKFLNSNNLSLSCRLDSIFFGKSSMIKDVAWEVHLNRGVLALKGFAAQGYDADYKLAVQAFFNTDQPYFKIEGGIRNFHIEDFFKGSGSKGSMSGIADIDYRYELSAGRLSDVIENSKGNLSIHISKGMLKNTTLQKKLAQFLHKNGYSTFSLNPVNFEAITASVAQQGEHFWFTNFGIRGDTLSCAGIGSYTLPAGMSSQFGMTVKHEEASALLPVQLSGPLLAPCIDLYNKKGSQKACM